MARRLRDAGRSRWLGLPVLVPLVGVLPGLAVTLLAPATHGRELGWRPAVAA